MSVIFRQEEANDGGVTIFRGSLLLHSWRGEAGALKRTKNPQTAHVNPDSADSTGSSLRMGSAAAQRLSSTQQEQPTAARWLASGAASLHRRRRVARGYFQVPADDIDWDFFPLKEGTTYTLRKALHPLSTRPSPLASSIRYPPTSREHRLRLVTVVGQRTRSIGSRVRLSSK